MENQQQKKSKHFKCYRCGTLIHIPEDHQGNPYTLLEKHYQEYHQINLKKEGWLKSVKSYP